MATFWRSVVGEPARDESARRANRYLLVALVGGHLAWIIYLFQFGWTSTTARVAAAALAVSGAAAVVRAFLGFLFAFPRTVPRADSGATSTTNTTSADGGTTTT